ncbi:MAG: AgmX/PglI C-terminal domain-containing protein [Byssovorax sp.]
MTLRSILPALSFTLLGCAASTPAAEVAPSPGAASQQAMNAPVTEVDLNAVPPPAESAKKPEKTIPPDARKAAEEFGIIGLLNATPSDPPADGPSDNDSLSAVGALGAPMNLWGTEIGDSYGVGGLGLVGTGAGAGGQGTIGLGSIGTIGRGSGPGTGQGFGSGAGGIGAPRGNVPKIRVGGSSVTGRLPPEVVQRIVRQNFGRFRLCYEKGLQKNAALGGKVSVRFVIGKDGATQSATDAGSDLPSKEVVNCVLQTFKSLSYPSPEGGGVVVVVYPIIFEPADDPAKKAPPAPPAPPAPAAPKTP